MPKRIKPLCALEIRNAKPKETPYKLFDGGGLYLLVTPAGGKHWKMKYRQANGKENVLSFGSYPEMSLEQARLKRLEARSQKVSGEDPAAVMRQQKDALANTFGAMAEKWLEITKDKVKHTTLRAYRGVVERDIIPQFGDYPIASIKPSDFVRGLKEIENKGTATAKRSANICSSIMKHAIALGLVEIDPISSISVLLKPHRTVHQAAMIDPKELGRLLVKIDNYGLLHGSFIVKTALKMMPYVFVRTTELCTAKWKDINLETCEWRYTVSKTNIQHIVPLSRQVVELLKLLHEFTGNHEYVFPKSHDLRKNDKTQYMSNTTMIVALRRMGVRPDEMTIHGFRAVARTLLDEELGERYDYIEQQLAHTVRDPNGRAYNRTTHLPERKRMMQRWADYLDKLRDEAKAELRSGSAIR